MQPVDIQEKLTWWLAEARRLLWAEGFGVATLQKSSARSSTDRRVSEVVPQPGAERLAPAPRESPEPPTVRESPADACGAQLVKHRPEFRVLSQALNTANAGDWTSLWNLAVLAAHFLGLIELHEHRRSSQIQGAHTV